MKKVLVLVLLLALFSSPVYALTGEYISPQAEYFLSEPHDYWGTIISVQSFPGYLEMILQEGRRVVGLEKASFEYFEYDDSEEEIRKEKAFGLFLFSRETSEISKEDLEQAMSLMETSKLKILKWALENKLCFVVTHSYEIETF